MKTVYVGFSFLHHGHYAGYDKIREFLKYDTIIDCQKSFSFLRAFVDSRFLVGKVYARLFGTRLWWVELKLALLCIKYPKSNIFHIIYGENIYKYLHYFKRQNKIVLTLHQPKEFFEDNKNTNFLKRLQKVDKIIVMSKDVEDYLCEKLPNVDVKFIPHGINDHYFKPKGVKEDRILMIGNWLRDFGFANKVFNKVFELRSDIKITIVTNKKNHTFFNNQNFEIYSSINDQRLLELYQKSKIVFLPLKEFTANNAVLEAALSGCNIIIATDKIDKSYYSDEHLKFITPDLDLVVSALIDAINQTHSDVAIMNCRNYTIDNFSWDRIALKTEEFISKYQ